MEIMATILSILLEMEMAQMTEIMKTTATSMPLTMKMEMKKVTKE